MNNGASAQSASGVLDDLTSKTWRACFRIGEVSLGLSGEGAEPLVFGPQIDLFRFESDTCDVELRLQWVDALDRPQGDEMFDSGSVWKLYEDGGALLFDFESVALGFTPYKRLCIDRAFRRGLILLNRQCFADPAACNPLEYPLDELVVMHRLGRERGVEVHAAGMRDAEVNGYLFLGHSGAGKSTTTRLWNQQHNVTVLSDDRIILRLERGFCLDSVQASDGVTATGVTATMYGTPWHGEAAFAAPENARVERLFILEHAPENKITPLTGSQAVGEVMARSFLPFYDAAALENTMSFLQEMVAAIPCYRLEFRPDSSAVEAVRRFRS